MARPLRVLVTIMDGEHRIHLRGDGRDVFAISQLSGGFFKQAGTGAGGLDTVQSGPESRVKELWAAWHPLIQNWCGRHSVSSSGKLGGSI